MDYRSAMRFVAAPGWASWVGITSATLKVFITDFQHVAPKNSSIFCSRMNVPVWSKAQGTTNCDSGGFSGSNTSQYADIQSVANNRITFSSGTTANKAITLDVTGMVQYYWANRSNMVFVFDNNGASQYSELWSLGAAGTQYNAVLTVNYDDAAPPLAPTPTAPSAGQVDLLDRPTFSWTHNDPDPQSNAEVRVYDASGTTLLYTWNPPVGSSQSLVAPVALTHGTTYQWECRTADAVSGYGPYSAKQSFTLRANPVVVIDATRYMEFYGNLPRLRVKWSVTGGVQYKYQVTAGVFNTGLQTSPNQSVLLDTLGLTNGTPQSVTVYVETADGATYSASATFSFTPRWGLTTHRRDLTAVPLAWGQPSAVATVPSGASLIFEYGSAATALAAPAVWYPNMSSVPLAQFVYWRAWFIPSSTAGPTLDYLDIPTDNTASFVDKWGTTRDTPGLTGVWAVASDEFVYGSRSVTAKVTGVGPFYLYAYKTTVKQGRNYILTGLMKSVGNSGACIELQDTAGVVLQGGGMALPPGPVRTEVLLADRSWFDSTGRDTYRYKTPIYNADVNRDVYVVLKVGGAAGSQAWFDAIKLEESTVATPWSPGAVGATVVDAGGVQVDASKGGVFRLRGTDGAPRSIVESGAQGLKVGGDTEVSSPATGVLRIYGDGSGDALQVGNDGQIVDVDVADTLGIQGQQNPANGQLLLGSAKDAGIGRTSAGTLDVHGATREDNNVWHVSADGVARRYYATNGRSYYQTLDGHDFRDNNGVTLLLARQDGRISAPAMAPLDYSFVGTVPITVAVSSTYYPAGAAEIAFTPAFVGQRFLMSMVCHLSDTQASNHTEFVQLWVTDAANSGIASMGISYQSMSTGVFATAFSITRSWVADRTAPCKLKLYVSKDSTAGIVVTVANIFMTVVPLM